MDHKNRQALSRRSALKGILAGASVIASGRLIASDGGAALSESDPQAMALGYKADHTTVDTTAFAKKAGPNGANQKCSTCALFIDQGGELGGCSIFPGKMVSPNGWCNVWAPKA